MEKFDLFSIFEGCGNLSKKEKGYPEDLQVELSQEREARKTEEYQNNK